MKFISPRQSILLVAVTLIYGCNSTTTHENGSILPNNLYTHSHKAGTRWVSFENSSGAKGQGGMENNGAKGHAFDILDVGESKTLLDMEGPGIINRIWMTIGIQTPEMMRSLVINMYWDHEEKPAVSVPFGDFFGMGHGKTAVYENALFANPEGKSFNSFVQMPFKTHARIEVVNESDIQLPTLFYDVNLQLLEEWDDDWLYFHCFWHRDTSCTLEEDFQILPEVEGKGRFLGSNISVNINTEIRGWWGEGEVKIFLDGDGDYPTLVGTGTEDYIGTGWGQGVFQTDFTGSLMSDTSTEQYAFYRYHIPDPVFFGTGCRVTIQQMGGTGKELVRHMVKDGLGLSPVSIHSKPDFHRIYQPGSVADLEDPDLPDDGWVNFYRSGDDLAAAAYLYMDSPSNQLPAIQPVEIRTWNLYGERTRKTPYEIK
ncbi:MAG: glycoside hydrolase family 172 protein [Bacteroidota bacterium]